MNLMIKPDGTVSGIYSEEINLACLGQERRIPWQETQVRPDSRVNWTRDQQTSQAGTRRLAAGCAAEIGPMQLSKSKTTYVIGVR
jgi:hypothetical protein